MGTVGITFIEGRWLASVGLHTNSCRACRIEPVPKNPAIDPHKKRYGQRSVHIRPGIKRHAIRE